METFLQSKEVKIPKQTAPISSTTSLAANASIVGANKMLVKEIDFKSSFARSLSLTNDDQDDDEYGGIVSGLSPCIEEHMTVDMCNHSDGMKKMLNSETENVIVSCSSNGSSGVLNATEIFNKSDEDKERLLWTVDQQVCSSERRHTPKTMRRDEKDFDLIYIPALLFNFFFPSLSLSLFSSCSLASIFEHFFRSFQ